MSNHDETDTVCFWPQGLSLVLSQVKSLILGFFTLYIVRNAVYHLMNLIEATSFEFTQYVYALKISIKTDNGQIIPLTLKLLP